MNEVGLRKDELDTPVLWVELDTLEKNIVTLAKHFGDAGVSWRPHTKGIKTPAIAHKSVAAGAIGITCAKLGEAEVMAAAGIDDILIANQIVTGQKITRLVNLRRHADVKVAVDNPDNILAVGKAAIEKGVEIGLLVNVDSGMNRAGVASAQRVLELAQLIAETSGVIFLGVMTWEGHTLGFEDPKEKHQAIDKAMSRLRQACRAL